MPKKIFVVCTEASGDFLAARLLRELNGMIPDLEVFGVGGDEVIAEGLKPVYHVRDFNVMGLFEVLSQLQRLRGIFKELVALVHREKPDLFLLVDAPDFNLRFAKAVKDLNIPIVYYVSPQVWAWRQERGKNIASLVDHMMVLFQFEVDYYRRFGLPTTWVGHPLVDELKGFGDKRGFLAKHGLKPDRPLVAIAPGSRASVVSKLLPVMVNIARARMDRYQFVLPLAPTIDADQVTPLLEEASIPILPGEMREVMAHADAALVASGTGTLETGLLKTPMIVCYKLKRPTYYLARWLVKIPHVALVNIVLGKRVVPEMIQKDFDPQHVLPLLDNLVKPGPGRQAMLAEFGRLESILGGGGASRRAAEVVAGFLRS